MMYWVVVTAGLITVCCLIVNTVFILLYILFMYVLDILIVLVILSL